MPRPGQKETKTPESRFAHRSNPFHTKLPAKVRKNGGGATEEVGEVKREAFSRAGAGLSGAGLALLIGVSIVSGAAAGPQAPRPYSSSGIPGFLSPQSPPQLGAAPRSAQAASAHNGPASDPTVATAAGEPRSGTFSQGGGRTRWLRRDVRVNKPGRFGLSEPAIAIDPKNPEHMIAVVMDYNYMKAETGRSDFPFANHMFRSVDGGRTWRDLGLVPMPDNRKGWYSGDPSIVFDSTGTAHMADLAYRSGDRNAGGMRVSRSRDGGKTWSRPRIVFRRKVDKETNTCWAADKELLGVDPRSDRLYLAYTRLGNRPCPGSDTPVPDEYDVGVYLQTSDDGGRTWSRPKPVYEDSYALGAFPVVGPDGTLYVVSWAHDPYPQAVLSGCPSLLGTNVQKRPVASSVVVAISKDGGNKWSYHKQTSCPLLGYPNSLQFGGGFLLPSAAVDFEENVVYVAWPTLSPGGTPAAIHVMSSADGGKTWSEPVRATPPVYRDAWMPAITAAGGVARLVYAASSTVDGEFDIVFTESTDRGETWSEPYPLNRVTSPQDEIVGDYMWLTTSGRRIAAIWADARRGSASDIYVRTGRVRR